MKIQFLGAAQTVTGSCYMFEAAGARFAIDCGMHQGGADIEKRNLDTKNYRAADIDFFLMTHAHIDHSGLLPRIHAEGFKGPIFCTPPTSDLMAVMLIDSAHIQEMEADWKHKNKARRGSDNGARPLYTQQDAINVSHLFKSVEYDAPFHPMDNPNLSVCYRNAGHILGAAFLELEITENGQTTRLVFSGDLGRPHALLVPDPDIPKGNIDYLFVESTYGDRDHKDEDKSLEELVEAITYSYQRGGKVIIPAFAMERTQEIIYSLHLLRDQGRLPEDLPVFVDSPLATKVTEIFRKHRKFLDEETQEFIRKGQDPLSLPNLRFTESTRESQDLNTMDRPAIIISASGMCNAGRIKHHLKHNLWRPESSIVFVGYQGIGTPGRRIVDGAKSIRLFSEDIAVRAKIFTIGGFSAHAGQSQIMNWIDSFDNPKMRVMLIHGEGNAQTTLAALIKERFHLETTIPGYMEEINLEPGQSPKVKCCPPSALQDTLDWDLLLSDMEVRLAKLRERAPSLQARPIASQTDLYERLEEIKTDISNYLKQL